MSIRSSKKHQRDLTETADSRLTLMRLIICLWKDSGIRKYLQHSILHSNHHTENLFFNSSPTNTPEEC